MPEYGSRLYWDKRYAEADDDAFDWMCDYDQLKSTLLPLLSKFKSNSNGSTNATCTACSNSGRRNKSEQQNTKILIVGCGNAPFSYDFTTRSGFNKKHISHIDYCTVVIQQQQQKYPELDFRVMDALTMDFQNDTFDVIIDKSLIDTTLCYSDGYGTTEQLFNELHRVLKPGGRIVTISLHTEDEVSEFKTAEDYSYEFLVSTCKLLNNRRQDENTDVRCLYHTIAVFDKVTNVSLPVKEELLDWHKNATFKNALTEEAYAAMAKELLKKKEGRNEGDNNVDSVDSADSADNTDSDESYDDNNDCSFDSDKYKDYTSDIFPFEDEEGNSTHENDQEQEEYYQEQEQRIESLLAKMEETTLSQGTGSVCE